jgi:hypothetical protein
VDSRGHLSGSYSSEALRLLDGRTPIDRRTIWCVPLLELSDAELADAAMAARCAATLAEKDAAKQTTLSMKEAFEESATRYRALAKKFEGIRSRRR